MNWRESSSGVAGSRAMPGAGWSCEEVAVAVRLQGSASAAVVVVPMLYGVETTGPARSSREEMEGVTLKECAVELPPPSIDSKKRLGSMGMWKSPLLASALPVAEEEEQDEVVGGWAASKLSKGCCCCRLPATTAGAKGFAKDASGRLAPHESWPRAEALGNSSGSSGGEG
jgi:hypothetical protein